MPYVDTDRRHESERRRRNTKAGRHPRETLLQVPNAPLREAFLRLCSIGEVSPVQVCYALDWTIKANRDRKRGIGPQADTGRLRRSLGLAPQNTHRVIDGVKTRVKYMSDVMDYEVAERICHALGVAPTEVGV
jgi:hypothetical protein